ncbi:AraC family transcriptional regulator [Paucihalobacter ruber]|uniref:AraC family transcriptional regulator n=1 Tax=Paucihalobacter ruber TaxID=2567861 RepID=A0A506PRN0_9FLAO|nr:helix-turn-helix domain-containing protein [Paucihalobacter ruber]TPV34880.1 AraC family transcriptional regulator [Paucihalobacter ruber]
MISADIASFICFSGFLLGVVILLILILANSKRPYYNFLLSLCIFSFTYLMFVSGLIWSGLIIEVPHFFRTASPVIYLIAPAAFLYVRAILEEEEKFKLIDIIHFLPALLHFLEMAPFFFQSAEIKIGILQSIFIDPDYSLAMYEGLLPTNVHAFLKTGIGLVYFLSQFYIIGKYKRKYTPLDSYEAKVVNWLMWFTLILTVSYTLLFIGLLINDENNTVQHFLTVLIGIALLIILGFLFFQPQILYGLSDFSESENLAEDIFSKVANKPSLSLSINQIKDYQHNIEEYLESKKPYLNCDFRMQNMVEDTGIPRHHLSAVINTTFKQNFSSLINEYRINYIEKNINSKAWTNLSIEGIGIEAGFKSRSTFLEVFKKQTGMTPSEFLNKASQL